MEAQVKANPNNLPKAELDALVDAVKKHAVKPWCYEHGWSVVVEAMTDDEILLAMGWAKTEAGAIRSVNNNVVRPWYSMEQDAKNA